MTHLPAPVDVGGLGIHPLAFSDAVRWIADRADAGSGGSLCTPNADYVIQSWRDAAFRDAILAADVRVPDGMWIVYAARLAGRPLSRTVTGRLLLPAVAEQARDRGWPIALYGAGPGVAREAADELCRRFPGLTVVRAIAPPRGLRVGSPEDMLAAEDLAASGARVVFVALGAPKQELWMQTHRGLLDRSVLVGVGAAFDIVAGRFREAPPWMTRVGLEWAFRLAQEPRRLVRRYLVDDPAILGWAVRERTRRLRRRGPRR